MKNDRSHLGRAAEDFSTGAWKYHTTPHRRGADGSLLAMIFAGLIVVLVSLMVGHVIVKALSKLAAWQVGGAW